MPKVYVVNKSNHDFSDAVQYGELVFLTQGPMNRYSVNSMARAFEESMSESSGDDYLLPCSYSTMNMVAAVVFALKHKKLNLLLFKKGVYLERNLNFESD